jgi:hypothetical protein
MRTRTSSTATNVSSVHQLRAPRDWRGASVFGDEGVRLAVRAGRPAFKQREPGGAEVDPRCRTAACLGGLPWKGGSPCEARRIRRTTVKASGAPFNSLTRGSWVSSRSFGMGAARSNRFGPRVRKLGIDSWGCARVSSEELVESAGWVVGRDGVGIQRV